jgi:thiol-disulfide isomerase/thioredoxin
MIIAAIALSVLGASAGPAERPAPIWSAPEPLVRLGEGVWSLYKGALTVTTSRGDEEAETISAALEVAYLGLGPLPSAPDTSRVLLLREAETPDDERLACSESVSLIAGPDLSMTPEFPIEDRARVSRFLFRHLPFGLFPPPVEPGGGRSIVKLHVLRPVLEELSASRKVEESPGGKVRIAIEASPGQRAAWIEDRVEIPVEVRKLRQVHEVMASDGRLASFESILEAAILEPGAPPIAVRAEVELTGVERQVFDGPRWEKLRSDAEAIREIEKLLFHAFAPDLALSRASAFRADRGGSKLARFAIGLGRQADDVAPIARERKLYGKPPPDFVLPDLGGNDVRLSDALPGKVTLLVFWGMSCPSSRAQAPLLSRLHEKYKDRGFQAIAVQVDERETRESIAEYAGKARLVHPILIGGSRAGELYDIEKVLPAAFWIDRRGRVIRRQSGFRAEMARDMERTVVDLLQERDAATKAETDAVPQRGDHHGGTPHTEDEKEKGR